MEMAIGALITLVIVLVYDKYRKPKQEEIDIETVKREKEISEHFEALLNYTPEQAYKRAKR